MKCIWKIKYNENTLNPHKCLWASMNCDFVWEEDGKMYCCYCGDEE